MLSLSGLAYLPNTEVLRQPPHHTTWWQNLVSLLLRMDLPGKSTMATDTIQDESAPRQESVVTLLCPWSTEYIHTLLCSCSSWACSYSTEREACTPKQTRNTVTHARPQPGRAEPQPTNMGCLHPQRQCEWERMVSRVHNLPSSPEIISWLGGLPNCLTAGLFSERSPTERLASQPPAPVQLRPGWRPQCPRGRGGHAAAVTAPAPTARSATSSAQGVVGSSPLQNPHTAA